MSQPVDSVTAGHTSEDHDRQEAGAAWSSETKQIHSGAVPDPTTGAGSPPSRSPRARRPRRPRS